MDISGELSTTLVVDETGPHYRGGGTTITPGGRKELWLPKTYSKGRVTWSGSKLVGWPLHVEMSRTEAKTTRVTETAVSPGVRS